MESQKQCIGPIEFQKLAGSDCGIALYGLNSPKDGNALTKDLIYTMKEVNQIVKEDSEISIVVLYSLVPGVFSSGANLKEQSEMSDEELITFSRSLRELIIEIEDLPMPVIAAIEGVAIDSGLELALACDMRVVANTARVGFKETSRGMIPGAGGTLNMAKYLHLHLAKELIFASRIIDGDMTRMLGMVNYCMPQNTTNTAAFDQALVVAREILHNSSAACRKAKQAINEGTQVGAREAYDVERKMYESLIRNRNRPE